MRRTKSASPRAIFVFYSEPPLMAKAQWVSASRLDLEGR